MRYIITKRRSTGQPVYWAHGYWYADIARVQVFTRIMHARDIVRHFGGSIERMEVEHGVPDSSRQTDRNLRA